MLFVIYGALTSYLFINWIIPTYSHMGFTLDYNLSNIFLSILYVLFLTLMVNIHKNKIKIIFIDILILQTIIPMLCLYCFTKEFSVYSNYVLMSVISVIIIAILVLINIKSSNIFLNGKIKNRLLVVMFFAVIFTIIRYIMLNGLRYFNLDFTKIYSYRFQLRETMSGYLLYLDNWAFKVFNPICIALSLYYKKKVLLIFFITLQIILYGYSSHKSVLFSGMIVVLSYYMTFYLFKKSYSIIKAAIYFNCFVIFLSLFNVKGMFCALYYRVVFMPAQINYYYYDYFSNNGFDWFKQSFLRKFFKSNYELLLPRIIGFEYFGNEQINANTGFLGSGYAQGGLLIILIYSLVIAILIIIISHLAKKLSSRLVLSITLFPITSLFSSGDLPTSLLTGGVLLLILLLYLLTLDKTMNIKPIFNISYMNRKDIKNKIILHK